MNIAETVGIAIGSMFGAIFFLLPIFVFFFSGSWLAASLGALGCVVLANIFHPAENE